MYLSRDGELLLGGFFSAKLRGRQASWIPCEIEALAIALAVKHFSPYITQSSEPACLLTDSRPCVLAFEKLCRGEFSVSPRVSTFLSVVSRYQMSIRHVKGSAILPSDFASRNAAECRDGGCQICSFVQQTEECVARNTSISVDDVLDGSSKLPFTTRSTWRTIQSECPDLRRTCAHLRQGTRPSKKITDIRDVKRYLLLCYSCSRRTTCREERHSFLTVAAVHDSSASRVAWTPHVATHPSEPSVLTPVTNCR